MKSNKKELTTQTFTVTLVDRFKMTEENMLQLLTTDNHMVNQLNDEFIEVTKKDLKADERIFLDLADDNSACISSGDKTISFSSEDFKEFVLGLEPLFLALKDKNLIS